MRIYSDLRSSIYLISACCMGFARFYYKTFFAHLLEVLTKLDRINFLEITTMSWVMVDVEADGPIPGDYSMISIGAVKMETEISKTFYAEMRPISDKWDPQSLNVCKFTRDQTLQFQEPSEAMQQFSSWLKKECGKHLFFISDNAGFDWQFVNWYFHHFLGNNPFGFGSTDQLSLYKGLVRDMYRNFKKKKYHPSHNALEDALANAKTLLEMKARYSLKINW